MLVLPMDVTERGPLRVLRETVLPNPLPAMIPIAALLL